MSDQRSYFQEMHDVDPENWPVNGIGGTVLHGQGIGTIKLIREHRGKCFHGEIKNVLFVPDLGMTLLSIGSITENGFDVNFSGERAQVLLSGQVIMTGRRMGASLYRVDARAQRSPTMGFAASCSHTSLNIWHQRLGHVNMRTVTRMASGIGVTGISIKPNSSKLDDCCEGCNFGKMPKRPFPKSKNKPKSVDS
jgi:GAG-pre-integrase domain